MWRPGDWINIKHLWMSNKVRQWLFKTLFLAEYEHLQHLENDVILLKLEKKKCTYHWKVTGNANDKPVDVKIWLNKDG